MSDGNRFSGANDVLILSISDDHKIQKATKAKAHVLYCIGQYQYTTTSGAVKTVPKYTLSKSKALAYIKEHPDAGLIGKKNAYNYVLPEDWPKLQHFYKARYMRNMTGK